MSNSFNFIIRMTGITRLIDGVVGNGAVHENDGFCIISYPPK